MGADKSTEKNTPNAPKFICPSPKVWGFYERRLHWASVVRGVHYKKAKIRRGKDLLLQRSFEEVKNFDNKENSLNPGFTRKLSTVYIHTLAFRSSYMKIWSCRNMYVRKIRPLALVVHS